MGFSRTKVSETVRNRVANQCGSELCALLLASCHAVGAFWTNTLYSVVYGIDDIAFRKGDDRYFDILYAGGPAAYSAVEMDVVVLDATAGCLTAAQLVFGGAAAVLERMNRMVLEQDVEGAEDSGFVHGLQFRFEVGHGYRVCELREFLEDEYTGRGRVYAVSLKLLLDSCSGCHYIRFFKCEDGKKCGYMKDYSSKASVFLLRGLLQAGEWGTGNGADEGEIGRKGSGAAPLKMDAEQLRGRAGDVEAEGFEGWPDAFRMSAGLSFVAGALLRRAEKAGAGEEGPCVPFHSEQHLVEPLPFPVEDAFRRFRGERHPFRRSYLCCEQGYRRELS